jgi:hypothetical protein
MMMKTILTLVALAALAATAAAQTNATLTRQGTNVVTRTNATLTWSNAFRWNNSTNAATTRDNLGLGYLGTNAATTISNLFASNSLPSGAAVAGAINTADGSGGSSYVSSLSLSNTGVVARLIGNIAGFSAHLTNVSATGEGLAILFPNITNNSRAIFYGGSAASLLNGFGINYVHVAASSSSNAISFNFNGANNLLFMRASRLAGFNTSSPDKALEINSASGNNLRLTWNDADGGATNFTDFLQQSNGTLRISNAANSIHISGLPTTNTGLASGVLWNSNGAVMVNP